MDSKNITKKYTNGEVTIVWKPGICSHSAKCWHSTNGLPEVFNPKEKPWIKPEGASTDRIIRQVKACPSGALSYFLNDAELPEKTITPSGKAEALPNGPLLVHGNLEIKDSKGQIHIKENMTAFCRCGASTNKPFCDGSHVAAQFVD
ncbi:MAG TPA: (4Fe-4S)-binding protein [Saprospiraceae bacterium]|nr:(4Fe-4S)-binding protein [Saprospiraceae bacterium]